MRRNSEYNEIVEPEPLAKRLGRFVALMGTLLTIAAAVIVTQRLSRDSLALLVGLSCGIMAMMPTMALGVFIWRREDARRHEWGQQQAAQPTSPPVIVVTPQGLQQHGLPGYGQRGAALPPVDTPAWHWAPSQSPRTFTIVGGDE